MPKHPCNCFGQLGQFETDMYFHEMGSVGCSHGAPAETTQRGPALVRIFETGATRDKTEGKPDLEGFFSPLALHAFAIHMMKHQRQSDGALRDSDNWQKGIPMDAYMKSGWRHFFDWWCNHRQMKFLRKERIITSICALLFNVMGYLHEYLKANPEALEAFEKECGYER